MNCFSEGLFYFVVLNTHAGKRVFYDYENKLTDIGNAAKQIINLHSHRFTDVFIEKYRVSNSCIYLLISVQEEDFGKNIEHTPPFGIFSLVSKTKQDIAKKADISPFWKKYYDISRIKSEDKYKSICKFMDKTGANDEATIIL